MEWTWTEPQARRFRDNGLLPTSLAQRATSENPFIIPFRLISSPNGMVPANAFPMIRPKDLAFADGEAAIVVLAPPSEGERTAVIVVPSEIIFQARVNAVPRAERHLPKDLMDFVDRSKQCYFGKPENLWEILWAFRDGPIPSGVW